MKLNCVKTCKTSKLEKMLVDIGTGNVISEPIWATFFLGFSSTRC